MPFVVDVGKVKLNVETAATVAAGLTEPEHAPMFCSPFDVME